MQNRRNLIQNPRIVCYPPTTRTRTRRRAERHANDFGCSGCRFWGSLESSHVCDTLRCIRCSKTSQRHCAGVFLASLLTAVFGSFWSSQWCWAVANHWAKRILSSASPKILLDIWSRACSAPCCIHRSTTEIHSRVSLLCQWSFIISFLC